MMTTTTTLGAELARVRHLRGKSLKAIGDAASMSATYLQRLERDEIASPSPKRLHALSEALDVPYVELMRLAGYIVPREGTQDSEPTPRGALAHALFSEDLTDDEVRALTDYLAFHRSRTHGEGGE